MKTKNNKISKLKTNKSILMSVLVGEFKATSAKFPPWEFSAETSNFNISVTEIDFLLLPFQIHFIICQGICK
jgi:hypothetical protein